LAVLPSARLLGAVALLVPLSLLGAFARPLGYVVLMLAGLLLLLFGAEALSLLRSSGAQLRVRRLGRSVFEVGVATEVVLELTNRSARRLRLCLVDGCPESLQPKALRLTASLAPGEVIGLAYAVCPLARGPLAFGPTEIRIEGRTGLAEHRTQRTISGDIRVHPDLRVLRGTGLRSRRALLQAGGGRRTRSPGRDGDFERLRDFVSGDDLRHIDWKATARLRRPITRLYRAEKSQTLFILLDASRLMAKSADGRSKMDLAVEAALHLAWVGLRRGDRVGVTVFDDRIRCQLAARPGMAQFGRILDLIYAQQPKLSFPRYRTAARGLLLQQRRRALVVWITDLLNVDQGQELLAALGALRGRHLSLVVAQDDPGVHRLAAANPHRPTDYFGRAAASEALVERQALLQSLSRAGTRVVTSGAERLSASAVDEYLDLKQSGRL
jgi:uncharacterized protein (DUF58 family)